MEGGVRDFISKECTSGRAFDLEKTFRSAVGAVRWRIKFLILGLGVIFGARIYTLSQELLFSGQTTVLMEIDSGALLIGSVLMAIAYLRRDFNQIGVHPSHAVLHGSLTLLLAGGYKEQMQNVVTNLSSTRGTWLGTKGRLGWKPLSKTVKRYCLLPTVGVE